jgi:hypothetical protein
MILLPAISLNFFLSRPACKQFNVLFFFKESILTLTIYSCALLYILSSSCPYRSYIKLVHAQQYVMSKSLVKVMLTHHSIHKMFKTLVYFMQVILAHHHINSIRNINRNTIQPRYNGPPYNTICGI